MKKLVGLTGYARSGKDTAAAALIDDGWERIALADAVRDALLALNPLVCVGPTGTTRLSDLLKWNSWDEAKQVPEVRQLLQRLGTEAGRKIHGEDCWVNIAKRKIQESECNVVVTDIRFDNEARMIHELGGVVIRVERPGVSAINGHASEAGVSESLIHAVVNNDGDIDGLHSAIREAVEDYFAADDDTMVWVDAPAIDDDPLSIFAGDREPTLSESLTFTEHQFGNVELRMW